MNDLYADAIAAHYAAYRPELHARILERALPTGARFATGLDAGCGTGYSALALTEWCDQVHAIDPGQAMLDRATPHPRVSYQKGSAERLPLPDASVDLATFAGSLAYVDLGATASELHRVCRAGATVVCYDFHVRLGQVLARWQIAKGDDGSDYDHAVNLAGLPSFANDAAQADRVALGVTVDQLAHVLLSDAHRFTCFADVLGADHPFDSLRRELALDGERTALSADLFYSVYRM